MTHIITHNLFICPDCHTGLTNGDYTELSLYGPEELVDARIDHVNNSLLNFPQPIYSGDESRNEEFSIKPCAVCNTKLAGKRYHATYMDFS